MLRLIHRQKPSRPWKFNWNAYVSICISGGEGEERGRTEGRGLFSRLASRFTSVRFPAGLKSPWRSAPRTAPASMSRSPFTDDSALSFHYICFYYPKLALKVYFFSPWWCVASEWQCPKDACAKQMKVTFLSFPCKLTFNGLSKVAYFILYFIFSQ